MLTQPPSPQLKFACVLTAATTAAASSFQSLVSTIVPSPSLAFILPCLATSGRVAVWKPRSPQRHSSDNLHCECHNPFERLFLRIGIQHHNIPVSKVLINGQRSYEHRGAGNNFSAAGCSASSLFYSAGSWVIGDPVSNSSATDLPCSTTPLFTLNGPTSLALSERTGFDCDGCQ